MTIELRIAELPTGHLGGLIGVTFAPGKKQKGGLTGDHDRDLAIDLDTVAEWNAAAVVTLMTAEELARYRIPTIGQEVRTRFMEWHYLPIHDCHVPDAAFEAIWPEHSARLRGLVDAGSRVLVHCRGGLGRAGMVAARLLVEMGADPEDAISTVRRVRDPKAIETPAQEDWVRAGIHRPVAIRRDDAATRDRAIGSLLGLAVGDAVGTTAEFSAKPDRAVLTDMVGGDPFRLSAGQWTDDTAMALALGDSLLGDPALNAGDLMRRFVSWYREGTYSCTGTCFDIGGTTAEALRRFERTGDPFAGSADPESAGNGSIMRLAPVAIRHWRDDDIMLRVAREQSRTTHGATEAVDACTLMADLLAAAIRGTTVAVLVDEFAARVPLFEVGQHRRQVRGTGYVVASLHAALWAVSRTSTFRGAVLLAANLGEDADTTAAVAGQIAGAVYGASAIPKDWLKQLAWFDKIESLAANLFDAGMDDVAGHSVRKPKTVGPCSEPESVSPPTRSGIIDRRAGAVRPRVGRGPVHEGTTGARLTFNRLLAVETIEPERVQLVRHQDTRSTSLTSPYALWANEDPEFDFYQRIQKRQVFRPTEGSLLASFVATPQGETLFVGMYGVHGIGTVEPGTRDPVLGHPVDGLHLYDLRRDPRLSLYAGKVVVEWGTGYRSWVQRAHKQDKPILEVRKEFQEQIFPGFAKFETRLSEVAKLPSGWRQVLRASKGIYMLTCPKTKEQYVGSATGEGGFQERWEQHALKGGDAVKFKSRDPADYRVVILEVAGTTEKTHDIQVAEQRWIAKLQSVAMGLNGNPGGAPAILATAAGNADS